MQGGHTLLNPSLCIQLSSIFILQAPHSPAADARPDRNATKLPRLSGGTDDSAAAAPPPPPANQKAPKLPTDVDFFIPALACDARR